MDPQNQYHFLKNFLLSQVTRRDITIGFPLLLFFVLLFNVNGPFEAQSLLRIDSAKLAAILPALHNFKGACDYSNGRWIWDDNFPLQYYSEDCTFLDPGFQCHRNGRVDKDYLKWRWQPFGCNLPRFNASNMLERSRNGRLVFVGDSIGRNQWESLVCMLSQAVSNKSRIYEQNGKPISKHKGYLSIRFEDYNCSVEYYRVPFLVTVDRPPNNSSHKVRRAIRVDRLHWQSARWVGSDVLVFNAGHWWNQEKTSKMGSYFQEDKAVNMSMGVTDAFQKTIETWKQWVIQDLALAPHSHIFFRSYSAVHFTGGTWLDGGQCDSDTRPATSIEPDSDPWSNKFILEAIQQIKDVKRNVQFLNITYLTDFRKDGHPSIHREPGTPLPIKQDCSHWCLPGVPDTWNELLYAYLLSKGYNTKNKTPSVNRIER